MSLYSAKLTQQKPMPSPDQDKLDQLTEAFGTSLELLTEQHKLQVLACISLSLSLTNTLNVPLLAHSHLVQIVSDGPMQALEILEWSERRSLLKLMEAIVAQLQP